MKNLIRQTLDRTLARLGAKVVSARWGPRGFAVTVSRAMRLHGLQIQNVIDVGAARGEWTRECLGTLPNAQFLMIDPLLENEPSLKHLTAEKPSIKYWLGEAGAEAGELSFHVAGDQSSAYVGNWDKVVTRTVPVRTLDSFVADGTIAPPDFIKADVQGFEMNVIQGATQCLRTAKLVLLETSIQSFYAGGATIEQVVSLMHTKGFGVYDFCSYYVDATEGDLLQSDVIFAPRPSAVFGSVGTT